ncbi:MAG: TonB-dependent receptor [Pseudomonadota bacterium]
MKHHLCTFIAISLISTPSFAQDEEPFSDIVVLGSRLSTREAFSRPETITATDIQRYAGPTILDAIDTAPGVRAFNNGGAGGLSFLSIRGGEPNFTQIFLEGIKLNDPTNSAGGAFDFAQINPLALQSVDVLKLGASAISGADSLSGSVNLKLKRPENARASLSSSTFVETSGAINQNAAGEYGWTSGGVLLSGGFYDSGDLYEGSDLRRSTGLTRVVQDVGFADVDLIGLIASTDRTLFPEDSGGFELAVNREREDRQTELGLIGLKLAGRSVGIFKPNMAISWSSQTADVNTPRIEAGILDSVPAIESDFTFERFEAIGDIRTEINDDLQVVFGAAYLNESGQGDSIVDFGAPVPANFDIERSIASGFAEAYYRPVNWLNLSGALRYDHLDNDDSEFSYRLTSAFNNIDDAWRLSFSTARNFKLPSLFALAYPLIANPNLEEERGTSYEISFQQQIGTNGRLEVSVFRTRFEDLIDFDPETFTNVNRSEVVSKGAEVSASIALHPRLSWVGSGTFLDTDNRDVGAAPLRVRPRWQARSQFDFTVTENMNFYVAGSYVGDFFNSAVPTGLIEVDGRFVVDAGISWRIFKTVEVLLIGRNLSSADYQNAIGVQEPGTVLRFGLNLGL